jgi:hypothetical protein
MVALNSDRRISLLETSVAQGPDRGLKLTVALRINPSANNNVPICNFSAG